MTTPEALRSTTAGSAWVRYRRMQVRLTDRISRALSDQADLSQADLEVLGALLESPENIIRDRSLRCCLEWEKSRLSHQLRRMEARGLVERAACFEDGRGSTVTLTEAGRAAAIAGQRIEAEIVSTHVGDVLSDDEMESLGAISDTILNALDADTHS